MTRSQKKQIITFAITRLNQHGYKGIKGKLIKLNKHRDILATYTSVFNSNPAEDRKDVEINNREFRIYKKSLNRLHKSYEEIERNEVISERLKEIKESEFVYVLGNEEQAICKIGYSTNPLNRMSSVQTGCPYKLKFLLIIKGNMLMEQELHKKYANQRLNGEWFSYSGPLKDSIEKVSFSDLNISKSF